ncbi:MAG TPA: hypothetical protein VIS96_09615 [Terrimicrobiaceae bacterium]
MQDTHPQMTQLAQIKTNKDPQMTQMTADEKQGKALVARELEQSYLATLFAGCI